MLCNSKKKADSKAKRVKIPEKMQTYVILPPLKLEKISQKV